jgi:16S rRNA (adenine1518-N6/adenine1519-N6)-dimethyltransferase
MSQTLREKIKQRIQEFGIEPKRSLGQNFLVSDSVVEKIIKSADLSKYSLAVEIGPGLGALTDELIHSQTELILFELDKKFCKYWKDQGQNLIEGDALKHDWKSFPWDKGPVVLISNLPYQISSRLVVELSLISPCFDRMVLMFQKEVAQRLIAEESTEDYGLLTVVAQIFWSLHFVLEAGAVDFMPKPNVASRVIRFDKKEVDPKIRSKEFLNFLKICFANRRKKMLPKLTSYQPKPALVESFKQLGLDEGVRAEKLSPEQFIELYLALKK